MSQRSPLLGEDDHIAVLKFFRYLAANEPQVLDNLTWWDDASNRELWTGIDLRRWDGSPLAGELAGIDMEHKGNGRMLAFLAVKAREFQAARPTLLRLGAGIWSTQATGRTERQRELRRAAIEAVVLRAAHEDTNNVLMSWDSLAKMIELMSGQKPGQLSIARLYEWFDSGESPFKVLRKGKSGRYGQSTTLQVGLPVLERWDDCADPAEQELTRLWLEGNDQVLGELYANEATRKALRPVLKGRFARAQEIREALHRFGEEAIFLFTASTCWNVQATPLSFPPPEQEKVRCLSLRDQGPPPPLPWDLEDMRKLTPTLDLLLAQPTKPNNEKELTWNQVRHDMRIGKNTDKSLLLLGIDLTLDTPDPIPPAAAERRSDGIPNGVHGHPREKILA